MNEKLLPLYLFLFFILVLIIAVSIPIIISKWKAKHFAELRREVLNTSDRYRELLRLTEKMSFNQDVKQIYYFHSYVNSKQKYDRFDFDSFIKEKIYNEMNKVDNLISKVKYNKKKYPEYQKAFEEIYCYIPNEVKRNEADFVKMEKEMLLECREKIITSPDFVCLVHYTSPQGRNSYNNPKCYSFEDLIELREIVIQEEEDKKTESYRRKTERSKMSDSLRFDVMERDGFRCVLCGRSAKDGVKLEVDHIKPVSKGGKTSMSNLQNLCKDCNRGKRDKYSEESMEYKYYEKC